MHSQINPCTLLILTHLFFSSCFIEQNTASIQCFGHFPIWSQPLPACSALQRTAISHNHLPFGFSEVSANENLWKKTKLLGEEWQYISLPFFSWESCIFSFLIFCQTALLSVTSVPTRKAQCIFSFHKMTPALGV